MIYLDSMFAQVLVVLLLSMRIILRLCFELKIARVCVFYPEGHPTGDMIGGNSMCVHHVAQGAAQGALKYTALCGMVLGRLARRLKIDSGNSASLNSKEVVAVGRQWLTA